MISKHKAITEHVFYYQEKFTIWVYHINLPIHSSTSEITHTYKLGLFCYYLHVKYALSEQAALQYNCFSSDPNLYPPSSNIVKGPWSVSRLWRP